MSDYLVKEDIGCNLALIERSIDVRHDDSHVLILF